jgi:hypothetical protein
MKEIIELRNRLNNNIFINKMNTGSDRYHEIIDADCAE